MIHINKSYFKILYFTFTIVMLTAFAQNSKAQCNEKLVEKAIQNSGQDAYFLKEFKVKYTKAKPESPAKVAKFSAYLIKGNTYRFNVENAQQYEGKAIMQLFKRGKLLKGNLDLEDQYYSDSFEYSCQESGYFQILMSFIEGKPGCAAGVMSLVINNTTDPSDFGITQTDSMERFYIGIDNELYIAASQTDSCKLLVSISEGVIFGSDGNYIVNVYKPGYTQIVAKTTTLSGEVLEETQRTFIVTNLKKPRISINGSLGGIITKEEILQSGELQVDCLNNIPQACGKIISFTVSNKLHSSIGHISTTNKLTFKQKKFIRELPPYSNLFFINIVFERNSGEKVRCKELGYILE